MTIYCLKKICEHNSACCVKTDGDAFACTREDILINDAVECDFFSADYNKLERCIECAKKSRVIVLNNGEDKYKNIKVNINQSTIKDFKDLFNKDNNNTK